MEAKKMVSTCGLFSELPILDEIFFKLSIKDVMRCKCVCKEWKALLSEPHFTRCYRLHSPFTALVHDTVLGRFSDLLEFSDNGDRTCVPFAPNESPRVLLGSSNGFLCIKLRHTDPRIDIVCVTNPLIGDPFFLPQVQRDESARDVAQYNFGYSSSLNKFKVLRIAKKCFLSSDAEECEILTVGVDRMWRRVPNSFSGVRYVSECVAINDAFHWLPNDNALGFISTFHLTQENVGQISLPPALLPLSGRMTLTVLGNQLAIFDTSHRNQISIWKMGNYSVLDSWNRVVVSTSWFPRSIIRGRLFSVKELKNGDMLFSYSTNLLISCNIEQNTYSIIQGTRSGGRGCHIRNYRFIFTLTPNFSSSPEWIMEGHNDPVDVQSE